MSEQGFEDFFTTIQGGEFDRMLLALRLRRFVDINDGQVIRLMPDFINHGPNLDEESKSFANWLLERFRTVENIR